MPTRIKPSQARSLRSNSWVSPLPELESSNRVWRGLLMGSYLNQMGQLLSLREVNTDLGWLSRRSLKIQKLLRINKEGLQRKGKLRVEGSLRKNLNSPSQVRQRDPVLIRKKILTVKSNKHQKSLIIWPHLNRSLKFKTLLKSLKWTKSSGVAPLSGRDNLNPCKQLSKRRYKY